MPEIRRELFVNSHTQNAPKSSSWEEAVLRLRHQPDQWALVRACFYDDPLVEAAQRYHSSTEWRAVCLYLPKERGQALDLGAGRGIASYALARDGWRVIAVEPDPSAVVGAEAIRKLAEETGLPIEVVAQYGEALPFPDHCFDLVHCRAVLHHARNLSALCREVSRVLRPGGISIATREHVISRKADLPAFLASHPLHRLYGGEHAYLLSEYQVALQAAGLKITHVLNPYASDINLFPDSRAELKRRIAERLYLPSRALVPGFMIDWLGKRLDQPGRHFSFIAEKPSDA